MRAWLEWIDSWYTLQFFFQTSWGRVCTQHCASRATSTTGLFGCLCHQFKTQNQYYIAFRPLTSCNDLVFAATARGSDGSIVFSIVAEFFLSVTTITPQPLHSAWWNFARTCTLTTSRTLLNIKGSSQRSRSHVFVCMILLEPVGLDSRNVALDTL